jgi:hypothetical protein
VFQRGTPPDVVYSFKHALVQDAAHGSLLRSTRQQLHAQIAEALEAHSPELMETQPELFARHYAEAGLVEKSVAFWGKAGRSDNALAPRNAAKSLRKIRFAPDSSLEGDGFEPLVPDGAKPKPQRPETAVRIQLSPAVSHTNLLVGIRFGSLYGSKRSPGPRWKSPRAAGLSCSVTPEYQFFTSRTALQKRAPRLG